MDLEQLKGAWQAREAGPEDQEGTMISLFARLDALERDVRRRDLREYIVACFVMAFFGWRAAVTGDPLVRLGAIIVVLGAMFIIVWSRRAAAPAARRPFDGDLPLAQFCARELDRVEAQVRLLKSVWWWYVTPTIVGVLLMVVPQAQSVGIKVLTGAVVIGVGFAIHVVNRWAAKHELEPLRDALAAQLAELRR